ncbi:MAG: hypothetical protein EU533_05215 [Promethearchaeota archaeon]|nr:MAG: hypothetical protein EU533_05215 [Candidatus Lokiarchaeota archaeon]
MGNRFKFLELIHDAKPNIKQQGGKGKNLVILANNGINVPLGIIVKTNVFREVLHDLNLEQRVLQFLSSNPSPQKAILLANELNSQITVKNIPKKVSSEIIRGISLLKKYLGPEVSFAVRSSALVEDQVQFSFAGQAESYCCLVSNEEIIDAIKKCWGSLFTPQALLYLIKMTKGIKKLPKFEMAVIIQHMIISNQAGVLFTVNVINNNLTQMLINSNWGLCESVTNNSAIPDMIILDKDEFRIQKMVVGNKKTRCIKQPNGSFTTTIKNDPELRNSSSLDKFQLQRLYHLGKKIERIFDSPQDIEWAIKNDTIYVLQSRPITTLNSY